VVTKAIAGLSDRKVQFTYADLLARTVSQLEAKPGVFEQARTGIDAAIEREQLIPLDREKGLFTSNIHVLDELSVKALSQEIQRQNHVSVTPDALLCASHRSAMPSVCWRRTGQQWGLSPDRAARLASVSGWLS
jgi:ATP-dependent exoDNAse (exonuclease V) alpha subunit